MNERLQSKIDEATDLLEQGAFVPAHFAIKKVLRQEPDNVAALIVKAQKTAGLRGYDQQDAGVGTRFFQQQGAITACGPVFRK